MVSVYPSYFPLNSLEQNTVLADKQRAGLEQGAGHLGSAWSGALP